MVAELGEGAEVVQVNVKWKRYERKNESVFRLQGVFQKGRSLKCSVMGNTT